MKQQIRAMVFETNSSMTHSLTIATPEEYEKFVDGELLLDDYEDGFVTPQEAKDRQESNAWCGKRFKTYREWLEYNEWLEPYHEEFTTPKGERLVAFGMYGHD